MNGIYLLLLLRELKPKIKNRFIKHVSIKERLVQIELGSDSLFISLFPQAPGIFIDKRRTDFERRQNFDDSLVPGKIIDINQIGFMPVCELMVERRELNQTKVVKVKLSFYREAPNFTVMTDNIRRNLFPRYIEKEPKRPFIEIQPGDLQNKESLIKNFEGLDKSLAQELDWQRFEELKEILEGKKTKIRLVSFLPLRISLFSREYIKEYDHWNALFAEGVKGFIEKRDELTKRAQIDAEIKKMTKRLEGLRQRLSEFQRAEEYRIYGELLLMNVAKIKRGMTEVVVFNPYTQKEIAITLDPAKSVPENAQEYFKRYKKLKRGQPLIQEQIERIEERISRLKSGEEVITETRKKITTPGAAQEEIRPFREFILPSGARVYVGKSAKSNMILTFKFARPDDYFFHVRGYEGAHAILKSDIKKDKSPRREEIEMAAAIAAYFSKAKTQKNVPVSYTQRKYLKKNKKGKLGSVILMREEVIFVDPKLPEDILRG